MKYETIYLFVKQDASNQPPAKERTHKEWMAHLASDEPFDCPTTILGMQRYHRALLAVQLAEDKAQEKIQLALDAAQA